VQNRPTYAIESVDRALRLAALLQQEGGMRITDAAEVLGISVSGTHRVMSMLVYRDFAEQLPDRSYGPGPVLRAAEPSGAPLGTLRRLGPRHLRALVDRSGESANLLVRAGTETRFVVTVETDRVLRVGDRSGRALPAHQTSGGKALLATLPPAQLAELYQGAAVDANRLHRSLQRVRADGYAVNRGETEEGVTAVGMVVLGPDGTATCAISVGMPTARYRPSRLPDLVEELRSARNGLEADLRTVD
jgi:IclR family acetate operon transcriptional repressor